ncbi:MAG: hypothetical protein AAB562_01040, partial [Patescibacteria group bacterium]
LFSKFYKPENAPLLVTLIGYEGKSYPSVSLQCFLFDGWTIQEAQWDGGSLALVLFVRNGERQGARLDMDKGIFIDPLPFEVDEYSVREIHVAVIRTCREA